jgi:hypothetical protein
MTTTKSPNLNSPLPPLVKVSAVASYLSVCPQTVRNLLQSGQLAAGRLQNPDALRKHVRITRASLLKYYREHFGHSLERALTHGYEP